MLPKSLRYDLRTDPDFFTRARGRKGPYGTLLWSEPVSEQSDLPAPPSPTPFRFAIIVKKTVASGVQRSQLKRKLRQAIVAALPSSFDPNTPLRAVVLIPQRKALQASVDELAADLRSSLSALV